MILAICFYWACFLPFYKSLVISKNYFLIRKTWSDNFPNSFIIASMFYIQFLEILHLTFFNVLVWLLLCFKCLFLGTSFHNTFIIKIYKFEMYIFNWVSFLKRLTLDIVDISLWWSWLAVWLWLVLVCVCDIFWLSIKGMIKTLQNVYDRFFYKKKATESIPVYYKFNTSWIVCLKTSGNKSAEIVYLHCTFFTAGYLLMFLREVSRFKNPVKD